MARIFKDQSPVVVDKAASYTVLPEDIGKVFVVTNTATLTLPAIANVFDGWNIKIFNAANVTMTITAPSGKLVAFNNAAATSLATGGASEKIGAGFEIIYDATLTKYLALFMTEETATITVS